MVSIRNFVLLNSINSSRLQTLKRRNCSWNFSSRNLYNVVHVLQTILGTWGMHGTVEMLGQAGPG